MNIIKSLILSVLVFATAANAVAGKIAYCSNNGTNGYLQVFVMNEDGTDKRQLTSMEENCMRPKWSPDSKQIVFYTDKGRVYLIRDIDKAPEREPYYLWNGYYPSFLPDGDEVMFNDEYNDVLSIMVIDTLSGEEPMMLSDGSYSNMQCYTPDGSKLVYSTFIDRVKTIVELNLEDLENAEPEIVSQNKEANMEPDISKDGKMMTYASFDDNLKGTIRIYKDGNETALTKGMPSSNVPKFSPDGKRIAFVVITESNVSLYVMDPDGNGKNKISTQSGNVGTYEWIDNSRIVFDAGTESKLSVGIVNVDNGGVEILASGDFNLHPSYIGGK